MFSPLASLCRKNGRDSRKISRHPELQTRCLRTPIPLVQWRSFNVGFQAVQVTQELAQARRTLLGVAVHPQPALLLLFITIPDVRDPDTQPVGWVVVS